MAEKFVADASQTVPIPDGVDFVTASCLSTAYGTTLHALRDRAQLQAGETLLVLGAAGGVGLSAVQIGKRMGARVIAAASSAEKLAMCKENGADEVIDYGREDLKERSRRSPAAPGPTSSTIRWAASTPSRRSARRRGKGASSSSASPPATSLACPRTSPC